MLGNVGNTISYMTFELRVPPKKDVFFINVTQRSYINVFFSASLTLSPPIPVFKHLGTNH